MAKVLKERKSLPPKWLVNSFWVQQKIHWLTWPLCSHRFRQQSPREQWSGGLEKDSRTSTKGDSERVWEVGECQLDPLQIRLQLVVCVRPLGPAVLLLVDDSEHRISLQFLDGDLPMCISRDQREDGGHLVRTGLLLRLYLRARHCGQLSDRVSGGGCTSNRQHQATPTLHELHNILYRLFMFVTTWFSIPVYRVQINTPMFSFSENLSILGFPRSHRTAHQLSECVSHIELDALHSGDIPLERLSQPHHSHQGWLRFAWLVHTVQKQKRLRWCRLWLFTVSQTAEFLFFLIPLKSNIILFPRPYSAMYWSVLALTTIGKCVTKFAKLNILS